MTGTELLRLARGSIAHGFIHKEPLPIKCEELSRALTEPCFDPVDDDELSAIRLEVSLLSPLESMRVADETNLLERLMPGMDGLVIIADGHHAPLLPTVWGMVPDALRRTFEKMRYNLICGFRQRHIHKLRAPR